MSVKYDISSLIKTALLASFFFISYSFFSQVYFKSRVELNTRDQYSHKKVIPIEKNGFIIQSISTISEDNRKVLKFDHYDTSIILQGTIRHLLHEDLMPFKTINQSNHFYSLFQSKEGDFVFICIEKNSFKKTYIPGKLIESGSIEKIILSGDYLYFYATTWREKYLYSINFETGKTTFKKIEAFNFGLTSINQLDIFPSNSKDSVYIIAQSNNKDEIPYLNKFDHNLDYDKNNFYDLKKLSNFYFSNLRVIEGKDKSPIIFGTYSSGKQKKGSQGIFYYHPAKDKYLCKGFLSLNSFFDFLPKKEAEREQKKYSNKNDFHTRTIFSSYITDYNELYLVTEFYYLSHYGEYFNYHDKSGKLTVGPQKRKGTKQLTHFVIWKFNSNGELEYTKKINYWPSYRLNSDKSFISLDFDFDKVNILYPDRDKIASYKLNNKGDIMAAENEQPIILNNEHDLVNYATSSIKYWYNGWYLNFGYQQLRNEVNNEGNRDVFYISKLGY